MFASLFSLLLLLFASFGIAFAPSSVDFWFFFEFEFEAPFVPFSAAAALNNSLSAPVGTAVSSPNDGHTTVSATAAVGLDPGVPPPSFAPPHAGFEGASAGTKFTGFSFLSPPSFLLSDESLLLALLLSLLFLFFFFLPEDLLLLLLFEPEEALLLLLLLLLSCCEDVVSIVSFNVSSTFFFPPPNKDANDVTAAAAMLPTVVAVDWPSFEPDSFVFSSSGFLSAPPSGTAPLSMLSSFSFFVPCCSWCFVV